METMSIDITRVRDAPSKIGEFYPATGLMADGRELQWISGESIIAVIIRDLALYRNDFRQISEGLDYKELDVMYAELGQMIDDFKAFYKVIKSRPITPTDIEELKIQPPMNPIEEAVGMMARVDIWLYHPYHDDEYAKIGRKARNYVYRLDQINDRLWTLIDMHERWHQ